MAILRSTKHKLLLTKSLDFVRQLSKPTKSSLKRFWTVRFKRNYFQTDHRIQNVFGKFKSFLQHSMNRLRQKFIEKFKGIARSIDRTKMTTTTKQQLKVIGNNGKETSQTLNADKPSIILVALNLLHRFIGLCVRFILVKVHGEHGNSMPAIDNLFLLDSATTLAEKIRTKKVSHFIRSAYNF